MSSTLPPLLQAVSGAVGSASAKALTYPLDLITTRVQLERYAHRRSARRILLSILRRHGVGALFDGILPDIGATLLSNFFYFYLYAFFRRVATRGGKRHKLAFILELAIGFAAGVASRAISTPLNIVALRLQTAEDDDDYDGDRKTMDDDQAYRPQTFTSVIRDIYATDGLAGFWRGFRTAILLCISPSLSAALYQIFLRVMALIVRTRRGVKATVANPRPGLAFLGGALSSVVASAILYPLILAKVRVQATDGPDSFLQTLDEAYSGRFTWIPKRRPLFSISSGSDSLRTTRATMSPYHAPAVPRENSSKKDKAKVEAKDIRGLYQGLRMQMMKGFVSQGVTYLVKRRIEEVVDGMRL
ncbi:mitochondrial carrier [Fistulina hepatica ATCC 64428]|uniref:Mitochondrial carrier n=1 Tax=Fistulina hepatica ATCC 64428 TaxID=1128425 RepID=A0A0D7A5W4_9AGAR|nr:mitochondrial carrier [Fistulina hepatica ATCC 64428]